MNSSFSWQKLFYARIQNPIVKAQKGVILLWKRIIRSITSSSGASVSLKALVVFILRSLVRLWSNCKVREKISQEIVLAEQWKTLYFMQKQRFFNHLKKIHFLSYNFLHSLFSVILTFRHICITSSIPHCFKFPYIHWIQSQHFLIKA